MANEDFTTYTEVDPNFHITKTASRVTFANLAADEDAYVYKDNGLNYFSSNFTILLTVQIDTLSDISLMSVWTLANQVSDCQDIMDANASAFFVAVGKAGANYVLFLDEIDSGTEYTDTTYNITLATPYYLKVVRNESIGTYGTLYLYTYSNSARTILLNTQTITLHTSKKDFQYLYPLQSWNTGWAGQDHDGYIENLDISLSIHIPDIRFSFAFGGNIFASSPTFTDVSDDLMALNTKRGRQHELDRIEAGTAVFTLKNTSGNWWRNNTTGAYTPYVKPLTRVRLSTTYATTSYDIFDGVAESFEPDWVEDRGGLTPIMTVQCVDLFKSFARYPLVASSTGAVLFNAELSGTRIAHVLNEIGFPTTNASIDTGQIIVATLTPPDGGTNAMEHLHAVAAAEGGILCMRGDGAFVFQDSLYRQTNTSQATFASSGQLYALPEFIDDDTFIYNVARILANPSTAAGIEQYYLASTGLITEQGERAWVSTDSVLQYDADAFDKCYTIVNRYKQSALRCQSLSLLPDADPTNLYPKVLGYDISDKITLQLNNTANPASINSDYHIEGIEHEWEAETNLWQTKWQLWATNQFRVFRADSVVSTGHTDWINRGSLVSYLTAHDATTGDTAYNDNINGIHIGQLDSTATPTWAVNRGFIQMDTTGLSATTNIISASLLLHDNSPSTVTLDTLHIVPPSTVTHPVSIPDYYTLLSSISSNGYIFDSNYTIGGWNEIPLNSDGLNLIVKASTSRFALRTDSDINTIAPSSDSISILQIDGSTTDNCPRLFVRIG